MAAALLGVDWGSTNRRAYLLDATGACTRSLADAQGLLNLSMSYAESLQALRAQMAVAGEVAVLMSGMVGSAAGWQNVPYVDTTVPLEQLPLHCVAVQGARACYIVPGYRTFSPSADVMRGEEMQLLGAIRSGVRDGWLVLPGTHSKWVHLTHGVIDQFYTFMTGELYSMLGKSGTLAQLMVNGSDDEQAFLDGYAESLMGMPISNSLFGVRARVMTQKLLPALAASSISGLLIGSEFGAMRLRLTPDSGEQKIHVIGSNSLARRYAQAAQQMGLTVQIYDPDQIYIAALQHFQHRGIR